MKTLRTFATTTGWRSHDSKQAGPSSGWTSAPPSRSGNANGGQYFARQLSVLADFLEVGLKKPMVVPSTDPQQDFWDSFYQLPLGRDPYARLNLWGPRRDEDGMMYDDRDERQRILHKRMRSQLEKGLEAAKREGGAVGRAAARLDQVLKEGMEAEPELKRQHPNGSSNGVHKRQRLG